MADNGPDVSVVIPAYRAEAFVARAIQSVLDQPGVDPEIIVVVDGLVDRTADIAKDFPKTQVVINEVNQGAPAARNRGLALARAPHVMFLDADDWVEGPLLQGLVEALDVFQADLAFGPCKKLYETGQPSEFKRLHAGSDERPTVVNNRDLIITLITHAYIEPCATMWRVDFVREQGGWNSYLRAFQDYEIVHRCLLRGAKAALTAKGFGVYYQHSLTGRITTNRSRETWQSQLIAISLIVSEAKSSNFLDSSISKALTQKAGHQMRRFARDADRESYREARKMFEQLGGTGHDGTLAHRIACSLLGLRIKEQLGLKIRGMRKLLVR
jgi:glycosyltransferase involved in cell wall biosynthesis